MRFPNSVSRIHIYRDLPIYIFLIFFLFFSGCSVTKIHREIPPSPLAVTGINYIYVQKFNGRQSILFNKILTHEINKQGYFELLKMFPNVSKKNTAILNAEVKRYVVKDIEEIRQQKKIILVEQKVIKKNPSGPSTFDREFIFVEEAIFVNEAIISSASYPSNSICVILNESTHFLIKSNWGIKSSGVSPLLAL